MFFSLYEYKMEKLLERNEVEQKDKWDLESI